MSMSSRDVILQRIRSGLTHAAAAGFGDLREPPVPEVWPAHQPSTGSDGRSFPHGVGGPQGRGYFLSDDDRRPRSACATYGCGPLVPHRHFGGTRRRVRAGSRVDGRPSSGREGARTPHATANGDSAGSHGGYRPPSLRRVEWVTPDWTSQRIGELSVGLIAADAALGRHRHVRRALFDGPGAADVLSAASLHRDCPRGPTRRASARRLGADFQGLRGTDSRGEIVLITGPSRTSDIEKVLILGVHGPKRLIVLVVE